MPKLVVETTGKNQATTTKVSNLVDIAHALKTEPECTLVLIISDNKDIMKYFSVTLNIRTAGTNGLRGRYTADQLADCLDKYIEIFTVCPVCRHPRVSLVYSKGKLNKSCAGCGAVSLVPPHKVTTYITNQLQANKASKKYVLLKPR